MAKYDYLIVGAGLFGAVFAYEAGKSGMPGAARVLTGWRMSWKCCRS